ncbi:MAG: hypothetical protein WDW38_009476 [Sanguina aurantia]
MCGNVLSACAVELRRSGQQHCLITTRDTAAGEVLLRVPRSAAIVIDYSAGMTLPNGEWPRLREGVMAPGDPLPWDILQALALVDALAAEGNQFWQDYSERLLPPPESLTLPMCWSESLLQQLQHESIASGARQQQVRLKGLFPELSELLDAETPSWFQWAFACVRSRSIRAGAEAHAFVPFLDFSNHAPEPTADFRVGPDGSFELFALQALAENTEATISYTGKEGLTNQRLMAQYGFVPSGGNTSDRLVFDRPVAGLLQLERLHAALGATMLFDIASGRSPYLYAAIKSLPFDFGELSGGQEGGAGSSSSTSESPGVAGGSSGGGGSGGSTQHLEAASDLAAQCKEMLAGCATTVEEDEVLLSRLSALQETEQREAESGTSSSVRQLAAVQYRLERKKLIQACSTLLSIYSRSR